MTIKISLTGDIFLADQPHMVGLGVRSYSFKTKILDYPFHNIKSHLLESDVVFGNLESSFSKKIDKFKLRPFVNYINSAISLKNANYNVVNIANNHIMENGFEGFYFTKKILKCLNINTIGEIDNNHNYYTKPLNLKIDNKKISLLGYSLKADDAANRILYSCADDKMIIRDIKRIKEQEKPNIIIISLHWGDEYSCIPHPKNVKMARKFIDSGANLIVGHHSHVIAPIEEYKNSFIIYGLGNFVFDMNYPLTNYGLLVDIILPTENSDYILEPHIIENQGTWIPQFKKLYANKLIYSSRNIDTMTKNIEYYSNILRINRKNYRLSLYKLLVRNLLKNPYYLIPFILRLIKIRRNHLYERRLG